MAQKEIELILMRQCASYLAMPMFVAGSDENLLFYNEIVRLLVADGRLECSKAVLPKVL